MAGNIKLFNVVVIAKLLISTAVVLTTVSLCSCGQLDVKSHKNPQFQIYFCTGENWTFRALQLQHWFSFQ